MNTKFISKGLPMWVLSLIVLGFLVACGSSSAEMDVTDTPAAVVMSATQTAEAPTATPTHTSTPTPTLTSTPEPSPTPDFGAPMVLIPAGEFQMGGGADDSLAECQKLYTSGDCEPTWFERQEPEHSVYLDDFYIDLYEVTNAQYAECMAVGDCDPPTEPGSRTRDNYFLNPTYADYPVIYVTWPMAQAYCEWRGARLPTEAEWEKAARGADGRLYPWGNEFDGDLANFCDQNCDYDWVNDAYDDGYADTASVGSYPEGAGPYGLFDMAGNVWEWVADWISEDYYADSPLKNPFGPESGEYRVLRGGAWSGIGSYLRGDFRSWEDPTDDDDNIGFRCARSVKPLTATPTPQPDPNAMVEAGLIAFSSDRDGVLGIYVMSADGTSDADILTIHPYNETMPAWSPSGEQIAYVSARDLDIESPIDPIDIYLINPDGSGLTRLTDDPQNFVPNWSLDNQRIAFVSNRDGNSEIYVMNADGSGVRRLTSNPALDGNPSWSPDGDQIAFESDRDGDAEIFIMNADGSNITQLTENTTSDSGPAWSPDGEQIAFASDRDGNVEIYVMNADGSNLTQLTKDPAYDLYQAWSPDGQMIAFTSTRDGNAEIYVMNADGSGVRRLTNNPAEDSYPSWSPPGEVLSTDPWFGPPWCSRDTDGDMQPDTPTSTFITDDIFAYIMFPFRNMEDGMEWSHVWIPENSGSMNNMGWWDSGESGFHVAMFSAPSWGSGKLTIQLLIEDKIVQEIECAVVEP